MVPLMSIGFAAFAYWIYPDSKRDWMVLIPLLDLSSWSLLLFPFSLALCLIRKPTGINGPSGQQDQSSQSDESP